jgi:hypothetical protein
MNKGKKWHWDSEQEHTFMSAKEALLADTVLTHYNTTKPLILACDASDYGIGAVTSLMTTRNVLLPTSPGCRKKLFTVRERSLNWLLFSQRRSFTSSISQAFT